MPTLTIRNARLKALQALARKRKHSIDQERQLLKSRLERPSVLAQIEAGWNQQTRRPTVKEVDAWIWFGRS
jgi:hypothetical protein